MKQIIGIILVLFSMLFSVAHASDKSALNEEKAFSIYMVRHAEKIKDMKDPSLTQCGQFRAKQLASLLEKANIKAIYSTRYKRTMATASPLALQQKLAIKNYAPNKLEQLALQLIKAKENVVIFGHSNTTPQMAELLSQVSVEPIAEHQYRGLYQVVVSGESRHLTLLMQPLVCKE
ncbi:MAG: histidine phosphatase family protein [Colwellia sp.]|nr:histidine phosphatase family protein [Colwellia sp.]